MAQQTVPTDGSSFNKDIHRLGQGMETLRTDVASLAHGAVDAVKSGATEVRHGAHDAMDAAKHKLEEARHSAGEAADSLKGLVSRNPMASLGIAAGVGLVLGLIVFRPRS